MVKKLTEDVCGGAMQYAELIHDKLRKAGYYDEEGQFDVTEQVLDSIEIKHSLMTKRILNTIYVITQKV